MFNSSSTEGVIYEYPKQKLLHQLNRVSISDCVYVVHQAFYMTLYI